MKKLIVCLLVVFTLGTLSTVSVSADPKLVIGKTVATPRTITIPAGTSSSDNGQLLRDTLDAITDAGAAKPYLIRLEPGTYSLGDTGLGMKNYVTIAGSGQNNTKISGSTGSTGTGVIIAASNSELRDLMVLNSNNPVSVAIGVYAAAVTQFRLIRVTVFATKAVRGASTLAKPPINRGLSLIDSSVDVAGSFIQATTHSTDGGYSYCIYNDGSTLDVRDTTLKAYAAGSGKARGIFNQGASPTINHVIIESNWQGEEDGEAVGILNTNGSDPFINDVFITSVADSHLTDVRAVGIDNFSNSSPALYSSTVVADADSGPIAVGMRSENGSSPQLHSTVLQAEAFGGSAYALFNTQDSIYDPDASVTVNSSSLVAVVTGGAGGSRVALQNNPNYTVRLGSTLLDGTVLGSGTKKCQACYDGNYDPLNNSCL